MTAWLAVGASCLDRLWDELPEEWLHNSYGDSRCTLDKTGLLSVLSSFDTGPNFWAIPTEQ